MTLDEARAVPTETPVMYRSGHGTVYPGVISSVGRIYVFVRFPSSETVDNTAQACAPETLSFVHQEAGKL